MSEEVEVKEEKAKEEVAKDESKDKKTSSKKRKRSRSHSKKRDRKRSRSRHRKRSPKRRRRSRDRHRRSRSRDKKRRSRERRSRRSGSRSRRKRDSSGSSSDSGSSSSSSAERSDTAATKEEKKTKTENGTEKSSSKSDRRDRRRSRSGDRSRRRSRTPRRKRRRSHGRRSRDRHRRSRSRKRSRSPRHSTTSATTTTTPTAAGANLTASGRVSKFTTENPMTKTFGQENLEEIIRIRKERVEKWRMVESLKKAQQQSKEEKMQQAVENAVNKVVAKGWTLEDDDDDDDDNTTAVGKNTTATDGNEEKTAGEEKKEDDKKEEEEEVDPLDAFMMELNKSSKPKQNDQGKSSNGNGPKVSRIVAVATKKEEKQKGELMEGNMDAMEYSSEEEGESLDSAFSKFQNKQQPRKLEVVVDHTKIHYEAFRKSFYVEVPELQQMTQHEVDAIRREELEGVSIRGKNCPKPILSWVQAGVSMKILNALKKAKYEKPTPIQAQAIPAIMAGNDLIGIAKTGSGKTVAFLLPMFRHIMDQRPLEYGEGPIAVIMTPTRELAVQINAECHRFAKALKLKSSCVYGGTGISEQIAVLKRGPEIVVCTPGRMIDMLSMNNGGVTNMRRCTYVVMDEADRMFDMGFEPQVRRVVQSCRPDRQLVMFSATFPRQMEALARGMLNKPVEVQVGGRSIVCSDVNQVVVVLTEEQKYLKLLELLGQYQEQGAVLVFVDKQERADHLLKDLMSNSYSCMALHGGIDQYDRDSIITDFKNGVNRLLIATSVAARGLDVRNLKLVVNFNCPNHYEDYVHRCGRTGRAGQKGTAYTFITPDQARYAGEIIKALELSSAKVPPQIEKLWLDFKREQTAQGKKVKQNSGFSGRGFKFDETEATLALERKKIQKEALGLQDSDEDEPAQDIDDKIESMFNSKRIVKDISRPLINQKSSSTLTTNQAGGNAATSAAAAKLEKAKQLASKINLQKNLNNQQTDVMQQAATALMKGGTFQAPRVSAKTIAEQVAERINSKLNYIPQEKPEENDDDKDNGQTTKHYEEELEINDFPQTCRWKVTSKDTLAQINEYSEASITIRGQFFPPGKTPGEDERKLYLAIEALSELSVQKAKSEVTRLIKEELIRLQNSYQPVNRGRYKVL